MIRLAFTWRNFEPAVLADPDVALDEVLLGEEHRLPAVVVAQPPAELASFDHLAKVR